MVTFEEFKKLDLRVGKIIKAEKINGSEKLLRLEVDTGKEKRQLVAGIGKFYNPEEIIGKEIIVIANLEPKIIFGIESQGMLLAANVDGQPVILTPDKEVPAGTKIT